MSPLLLGILVCGAVVMFFTAGAAVFRDLGGRRRRVDERLDVVTGRKAAPSDEPAPLDLFQDERSGWDKYFGWLPKPGVISRLAGQADVHLDATGFVAISAGLALAGGLLGFVTTGNVAWAPAMAVVLGAMPTVWLVRKRSKRLKKLGSQLPDALDLVGRALRAGHSLAAGMNVVAEEMAAPISTEFGRVYEEQNLGVSLEDALDAMTERVPNLDIRFFVTAVLIQRQTGGDLAEILDKISYVIRERFKVYGQVQALTAEGRLSGVVLMVLPLLVFLGVYHINRPYIEMLFTEPLGRKMLAVAIVLQVLGAVVIRKIVNIKV